MKKITIFLLIICTSICYAQAPGVNQLFEQQKTEALNFNSNVTDKEIIEFLEFQYQIDSRMLKQLKELMGNPDELKEFLSNYRRSYNEVGMKLPTLKGMSEQERAELVEIFEFKKREYYEAIEAEERLDNLTKADKTIVLKAGIDLINKYESLMGDSKESTVKITDNFPESLSFLKLSLIYLSDISCSMYLQKGIGKGIGYTVLKENGQWKLQSFNEYKSWERKEENLQ